MSVLLPDVGYTDFSIVPVDFGGMLSGTLGGEDQILNRLGDRFALRLTTPPLLNRAEGRIFFHRLLRGRNEGVLTRFPQNGMPVGAPGAPLVNGAVASGSTLTIKGLTPSYVIREGQPMSIIGAVTGGTRRYLHFANGQVIADSTGHASITVTPMLRRAFTDGNVIEIGVPMIEGGLDGDPVAWERSAANSAPFVFTVREMA